MQILHLEVHIADLVPAESDTLYRILVRGWKNERFHSLTQHLQSSSQVKAKSEEHFLLSSDAPSSLAAECGHEDGTQISHTLATPLTAHSNDSSADGSQLASDNTVSRFAAATYIYRLYRPTTSPRQQASI